jgi:hypothetical protein
MSGECVKVVVRIRPLSSKEVEDGRKESVRANSERAEVVVSSADQAAKTFTFDATFGSDSKQEQLYDSAAYPIVESVLKGFNGTILAVRFLGRRAPLALGPQLLARSRHTAHAHTTRALPSAVRPNWRGQVPHHGGPDLPPRAARHHPQGL